MSNVIWTQSDRHKLEQNQHSVVEDLVKGRESMERLMKIKSDEQDSTNTQGNTSRRNWLSTHNFLAI